MQRDYREASVEPKVNDDGDDNDRLAMQDRKWQTIFEWNVGHQQQKHNNVVKYFMQRS